MLASLATRPPPPGLARLLRARPRLSPSRPVYGTPPVAEGAAGIAGPRLLPDAAAKGRREPAPPPVANSGLPWRGVAWGGRQRGLGGRPLGTGPDPGGSPLPAGPGPGGTPLALGPGPGLTPVDMGPGPKGTPTVAGPRLPVPGAAPLRTPQPGTPSPAGAGRPVPWPWPPGAEHRCHRRGDPGGRRSRGGSCPPGAAVPALIAALTYCYVRDHLSKGDYCCSPGWEGGGPAQGHGGCGGPPWGWSKVIFLVPSPEVCWLLMGTQTLLGGEDNCPHIGHPDKTTCQPLHSLSLDGVWSLAPSPGVG